MNCPPCCYVCCAADRRNSIQKIPSVSLWSLVESRLVGSVLLVLSGCCCWLACWKAVAIKPAGKPAAVWNRSYLGGSCACGLNRSIPDLNSYNLEAYIKEDSPSFLFSFVFCIIFSRKGWVYKREGAENFRALLKSKLLYFHRRRSSSSENPSPIYPRRESKRGSEALSRSDGTCHGLFSYVFFPDLLLREFAYHPYCAAYVSLLLFVGEATLDIPRVSGSVAEVT